jgi:hypothetical protein
MLMVKKVFVLIGFNVAICRESAILNAIQHVPKIVFFLFLLIGCVFGAACASSGCAAGNKGSDSIKGTPSSWISNLKEVEKQTFSRTF